ncbi:N-acetylmuramoyl-L-alanine amidase family protein [Namhaeicola litoreus]|uniref:N-acetylmuramoyl-L-alanine amidase n=1 Tax=Namhaeicola litoreus TaxID=1052145 RepID=A0ABW3Y5H2_9FLAO
MKLRKALVVLFFIIFSIQLSAQKGFVVVLDAGHGGKDPGRPAKSYIEKDIALNIVLKAGEYLKKDKGVNVVYTRDKDVFVELEKRGKIANDADANLFVSVHCNAHNTQASGTETYVLGVHANKQNFEVAKHENSVIFLEDNYEKTYAGFDPNSPEAVIGMTVMQEEFLDQSLFLASLVEEKFKEENRVSRGVKQAGFVVLHQTYMPSILIETGFITNSSEGAFLNSKQGQEKVAKIIGDAILSYKSHLDKNTVVETVPVKKEEKKVEAPKIYEGVDFRVQIASSTNKLDLKPYNFKGLSNVEMEKIGKHYKYYYGNTNNYSEISVLQKEAREKGYKTAFVVAFRDGKNVPLKEIVN